MVIGTCASCSRSGVSPPSDVVPQPTIASSVPGVHSASLFATCVGALGRVARELEQRDVVARAEQVVRLADDALDGHELAAARTACRRRARRSAAPASSTSEPVTPAVAEAQWPALSTQFGAISVPVQRKLLPNVISAIDGYAPAGASFPPTMAFDGAAVSARQAQAAASASVVS